MGQEIVVSYKAEIDQLTKQLDIIIEKQEQITLEQEKGQDAANKNLTNQQFAAKKRLQLIKLEEQELAKLKQLRTLAFDPKVISDFDKKIEASTRNIKLLGSTAKATANETGATLKSIGQGIAQAFGATLTVAAVIQFGKASVNAFLEAESTAKRLRNAIINISGATEKAFDRLIKQSEELQKITIFSDDSIQSAQTALATFGLTADEIENLLPKLADFATASGKSLEEATQLVGSGLEGIGREFKKYRIEVSATASRQENLNVILNGFVKFAGSAEEAAQSFSGQVTKQRNEINDLQEIIGKRLLPAFLKLQQFGLRAVKVISDLFAEDVQSDAEIAAQKFTKIGTEFNLLIETLQRGNLTQEQRKDLIGEINTQYGEYLPNLLTEKSSLEDIAAAQAAVNKQLEGRIILVALEEDITRITKNAVAATKSLLQVQKDRIKAEKDLSDNAQFASLTRDQLNQREALANELLKVAREELGSLQKAYADLAAQLGINLTSTNKVVEAENDLRQVTTEVIRELEKITDIDISKLESIFIQSTIGVQSFRTAIREASDEVQKLSKTEFEINLDAQNAARIKGFVGTFKDGLSEIEEETKITTDQILSETQNLVSELQSLTSQYTSIRLDEIEREKNAQMESYDEQQRVIDENLQKRRISETEAARLTAQLLEKRTADQKRAAEKERALKRKQFDIDKAAALIQIIINTAQAVTAALTIAPPAGEILAALNAALGAAQGAVVASQPNPYKKGTKSARSGLALVDEEGHEAIFRHSRGRVTTLERGDKVIPVRQTQLYAEALDAMFENRFSKDYVKVKDITPRLIEGRKQKEQTREKTFADNIKNSIHVNVATPMGRKLEKVEVTNLSELVQILNYKRDIYGYR